MQAETLIALLEHRAHAQPEKRSHVFLKDGIHETDSITYAQLATRAKQLAVVLRESAEFGDRALLLYPSSIDYVVAFYACLYAGLIAVSCYPPDPRKPVDRVSAIAADCTATLALTTQAIADMVAAELTDIAQFNQLKWLATDSVPLPPTDKWHPPAVNAESVAFLQYTSGSTSAPKGVIVSHGNLLANGEMMQRVFDQTADTIIVTWLPLHHDMGLIGQVLQAVYLGATCIIMPPIAFVRNPASWLKAIDKYDADFAGSPNFGYDLCTEKIPAHRRRGIDLSRWRIAFNGAEPIRASTIAAFNQLYAEHGFGGEPNQFPVYGLAEATLIASGQRTDARTHVLHVDKDALTDEHIVKQVPAGTGIALVGCGQTVINQTITIVDPNTYQSTAPDHVGEIWLRGPNIALGYWDNDAATEATFGATITGGDDKTYLRTGDLGFLHDGELYVTGRLKELLIFQGRNHYPQDIELTVQQFHDCFQLNGGAAFQIEVGGSDKLVIVQELSRRHRRTYDSETMPPAIIDAIKAVHRLAVHELVIIKPRTLDKTSSGKIMRNWTRTKYLDGTLTVIDRWQQPTPTKAKLLR